MGNLMNIDFEPLAEVTINLLNKLEKAVGWCLSPKGDKKDFEEGVKFLVEEIKKDENCPAIVKTAKISNVRQILREYKNQYDIVQIAINNIEEGSKTEEVDDDWLDYFMDKCKNISYNQIKIMFGKLLAEECKSCGQIDKSLIHLLSIMSAKNAKAFQNLSKLLFNCTVENEKMLIIITDSNNILREIGLTYDDISELCSLGLIEAKTKYPEQYAIILKSCKETEIELEYHGEIIQFVCCNGCFPYGSILLTLNGTTLMKILIPEKLEGYLQRVKRKYERTEYEDIRVNEEVKIDIGMKDAFEKLGVLKSGYK